jgi:TonB family protein
MPSRLSLVLLLASGCATTTSFGTPMGEPIHARVTLAPLTAEDTVRVVPHAIDPMLPTADRLARVIANRLGEQAKVGVRYCVSPSGELVSAQLARSSSLRLFDNAVMTDISRWRFAVRPGPAGVRTCQQATIIYRPPA